LFSAVYIDIRPLKFRISRAKSP